MVLTSVLSFVDGLTVNVLAALPCLIGALFNGIAKILCILI